MGAMMTEETAALIYPKHSCSQQQPARKQGLTHQAQDQDKGWRRKTQEWAQQATVGCTDGQGKQRTQ